VIGALKLSLLLTGAMLGAITFMPTPKVPNAVPAPRAAPAWQNRSWLNATQPVTIASLEGKVVLVNFWVYSCHNCTNTLPALRGIEARYKALPFQLIGIHTPEFGPLSGEHDRPNVEKANARHGVTWPVGQDNDNATWNLYGIRYWPSFVLIDKRGQIRYEGYGEFHSGDGADTQWRARIDALLREPA